MRYLFDSSTRGENKKKLAACEGKELLLAPLLAIVDRTKV